MVDVAIEEVVEKGVQEYILVAGTLLGLPIQCRSGDLREILCLSETLDPKSIEVSFKEDSEVVV